jgi:hypothetical protein
MIIDPFLHQKRLLWAVENLEDRSNFFLVGGYRAGKSTALVFLILWIAKKYGEIGGVNIGIGSPTLTFFKKTVWQELEKYLIQGGIKFRYAEKDNVIYIAKVRFFIVPIEEPQHIYGYSWNAFLCDELDEMPQHIAMEVYNAGMERASIIFPPVTVEEKRWYKIWEKQNEYRRLEDSRYDQILHNESAIKRGRGSFKCFVTTAQGYRGTYQIVEDLKRKGIKYCLIRGLTKDNTALTPSYYADLCSKYTENERKAFLEGEFINLTSGRVYGEYDQKIHMVNVGQGEFKEIWVGQDFNTGFSKAVVGAMIDDVLVIIKTYSFKSIGDAPSILRTDFPTAKITWYPDATAKEIFMGYMKEIRMYDIEIRMFPMNPGITDRVMLVNKMFRMGYLKLSNDESVQPLDMALKTRIFDDSGKPEKGKGEKATDHVCDPLDYLCVWRAKMESKFSGMFDGALFKQGLFDTLVKTK